MMCETYWSVREWAHNDGQQVMLRTHAGQGLCNRTGPNRRGLLSPHHSSTLPKPQAACTEDTCPATVLSHMLMHLAQHPTLSIIDWAEPPDSNPKAVTKLDSNSIDAGLACYQACGMLKHICKVAGSQAVHVAALNARPRTEYITVGHHMPAVNTG